ncbi:Clp protease N-terminal domain-containing protein [Flavobacterium chungangense]|nr:Clp protease N-terminal domain-containing protein [Flavobacterium chungangense]
MKEKEIYLKESVSNILNMQFNQEIEEIIKTSRKIALNLGENYISSYHFLLAMVSSKNLPHTIFDQKELDFQYLTDHLQKGKLETIPENMYMTKEMERALKISAYYAWIYRQSEIKAEHILFAMLADKRSFAGSLLIQNRMTYSGFENEYEKIQKTKKRKLFKVIGNNSFLINIGFVKLINQTINTI